MVSKKRLFGTFGVRRTANDVLTPEFASRLAASYGTLIQGKVAIGSDTRTTSPMLMHAITSGLLSSGCDVVNLGTLPTPAVQYATRNYYDGGIIITASHNPPKYNGIKFVDEYGIGIPDNMELAIEEMYFDTEPKRAKWNEIGNVFHNDKIIDEYIEEVLKKVDTESIRKAKLKVVLDCGSGAGSYTAP
jgi:phosphomannomutase/phosphoglucomutase